jgi:hypothetical protein
MHAHINATLYEHIDGLTTMAPPSKQKPSAAQPAKGYNYRVTLPTAALPALAITPVTFQSATGATKAVNETPPPTEGA